MDKKGIYGLFAAVVILISTLFLPAPEGMTEAGKNTLGILIAALILWTTEAVPIAITAIGLVIMQYIYGIADLNTAIKAFMSSVIFFVIASFGFSAAIMKTPLAARMARWLLAKAGRDARKVILAFVTGTAVLSSFVSNVPATALFMGLALGVLSPLGAKPGSSRLGKALMIAIPFGAMIGGIATPAGSSINILVLYLLETYAQTRITFVDWMVFGIPVTLMLIPISTYIIVKIFKPEPIEIDISEIFSCEKAGLSTTEKKVLAIIGLLMFFWIISAWIPAIDITVVAVLGLIALFMPGINVLTWDEFVPEVGWDAVLMIGGVTSIGAAVVDSGLSAWFMNEVLNSLAGLSVTALTFIVGLLINFLHLVLPIAPALVAVSIQPLSDFSSVIGISPAVFGITTAFLAGCCLLLPLDAVPLITYNKKFYSMWDMFKAGFFTSIIWVAITALWVPFAAKVLGY